MEKFCKDGIFHFLILCIFKKDPHSWANKRFKNIQ